MSPASSLVAIAATTISAVGLISAVFLSPNFALASEPAIASTGLPATENSAPETPDKQSPREKSGGTACTCPPGNKPKLWNRPKFADYRTQLDEADEVAALESVQLALSEVGDGSTYVWHRMHGRLSGIVQPTSSFKDAAGSVCRHIIVMLTSGTDTKRTEGIACRLSNGRWQLEG